MSESIYGAPTGDPVIDALQAGERTTVLRRHLYVVVRLAETSLHTARPTHLVACLTCDKLLHMATTGALFHIRSHEREVEA